MPTSAQLIVESGAARATSNDLGKVNSDGELLGRVNRFFLSLYALAARQRPNWFTSTATLALTGAPATLAFASATPALTDVIDITRVYGVSGTVPAGVKIHLVDESEVYRSFQIAPCVFQRGLSLVSRGQAGDPVNTDVIGITVLDSPTPLTTLATNLDARFPARFHEILINDVALYLETKDDGPRVQSLMADQKAKMMAFANEYSLTASAIEAVFSERVAALQQQSAG